MHSFNVRPIDILPRQCGATLVEFAIVSVPLLLCGLLLPEAAQWQLVRQVAHLALVEAGRAGATEHAQPAAMQAAFEQALLPLHAGINAAGRMKTAFEQVERLTGLPPWRIEVLQPGEDVFRDFADPDLHIPQARGRPTLRNNFQAEQQAQYRTVWRGGVGPMSGRTIFEANVLHLRLVYLHKPMFPLLRALLKKLGNARGSYGQRAMAQGGVLPITLDIEMDMQSHAVDWSGLSLSPRARVIPGGRATGATMLPTARETDDSFLKMPPFIAIPAAAGQNNFVLTPAPHRDIEERQPDPACGVALCCTNDG
jgi:hypothetical protein